MAKAHTCSVSEFVSRPTEFVQYYDQSPRYVFPTLYQKMIDLQAGRTIPQLSSAITHASLLCDELGPWPAERVLELSIHDAASKLKYSRFKNDENQEEMEDIVDKLDQYIRIIGENMPLPSKFNLSLKVLALLKVLEKFRSTRNKFCGILFCKQRWTACVLAMVVKYY